MKQLPKDAHSRTRAIHTGVYKDEQYRSVTTPIYTSSTFAFDGVGKPPPFDYTRSGNPTRQALNENIAALEGGVAAYAVATGMAAVSATLMILEAGDHVICGDEIYGGSHRLFSRILPKFGVTFTHVDMTKPENVRAALKPETKMLYLETPTNPLLNLVDIAAMVEIAKERKLLTAIDNTFMTPLLQRPFKYGVDLIVHSTTKYINGHSDIVGGAVVARTKELAERVYYIVNAVGLAQAPLDSWLTLRGVKTLPLRLEAAQKGAMAMAEFLAGHRLVKRVFYPGLDTHPQRELAKRQQGGPGAMLSFELDTDKADMTAFFRNLNFFSQCVSLGGVESLIEQPWSMSHESMPAKEKLAAGITEGIVRVSAGTEHPDDLVADLKSAMQASRK